jgi:hypothetical protein
VPGPLQIKAKRIIELDNNALSRAIDGYRTGVVTADRSVKGVITSQGDRVARWLIAHDERYTSSSL